MKRACLLGAALALDLSTAYAQSTVTLYGLIDENVRYVTNVNAKSEDKVGLGNGGLSESMFGLKGTEDLGGGLKAVFQIENRFFPNSGITDPAYPFFNTAFVGLQSAKAGRLTLGRQFNPLADAMVRNYSSNAWLPTVYVFKPEATMAEGVWSSNMAKYVARYEFVQVELSYSFGNVAGEFSHGRQMGAMLEYSSGGPFRAAAAWVDATDANNGAHSKAWTLGASYLWGNTRFNAGYVENRLDAGFSSYPNGPFTPAALAALKYTDFSKRRMYFGGVTQQVGDLTHISGNVWRTLQDGQTASKDGSATQYQMVLDYGLSKRTSVYAEVDYADYRGGLIGAQLQGINAPSSAGTGNQLGAMLGMRHVF